MKLEIRNIRGASKAVRHLEWQAQPGTNQATAPREFLIHGEALQADCARIAPGRYSILINGRSYEAHVSKPPGAANGQWTVLINGCEFHFEATDPRNRRFAGRALQHDGPMEIAAPMPGRIVKLLVAAGDEVEADQSLAVIEAMKMQNELRAPRRGRISAIHVAEGAGIEAGAKIMRLD